MSRALAGVGLSLALGAAVAQAQEPALGPPTTSADLVLRRADFVALELLSLEDLLREQAGIAVLRRGAMGSAEALSIAGSGNGRVHLVLDGVEIAVPELEWPRLYAVPLAMVDSVAVWRSTDPAWIAVWMRRADGPAPSVDFDLGRGQLVSRTRRVDLFTPPRAVTVAVAYDELLRSGDDFRSPQPSLDTDPELGAYDNRSLLVRIDLLRGDDALRVEHYELEDNSHGSFDSQLDRDHTNYGRDALHWARPLGNARLGLDAGHQAWDHDRRVDGDLQRATEARSHAALRLELPPRGAWSSGVRAGYAVTTGDRTTGAGVVRATFGREDLEAQASRQGDLRLGFTAGAHHDERAAWQWSGRARAGIVRGAWEIAAQAGRGVTFAGWGEAEAGAVRTGADAGVGAARRSARVDLEAQAFVKSLAGGSSSHVWFPELEAGPARVGGLLAGATWRATPGRWQAHAAGSVAWMPEIRGDPAGCPKVQARFDVRGGRTLRGGDLGLQILSTWALDARRPFVSGTTIAPSALGDVTLDILVLQRADFFVSMRNLTDARVETYPGVYLPGRLWWFGFRLRLFD